MVPPPAQTHGSRWLQASCSLAVTGDGTTAKGTVTPGAEEGKPNAGEGLGGAGRRGHWPGPGEKFMRGSRVQVRPVPQSLLGISEYFG